MKKYILVIVVACAVIFQWACKKDYGSLSGDITLTGYAYLADTISNLPPSPLAGQKFYLNAGSDTSSYIFQGTTDSIGRFSIQSLDKKSSYVLFTRFIKNNTEYSGAIKFEGKDVQNNNRLVLNVYPVHGNGMALLFTDLSGGYIPNLAFRLYTSRVMALSDSVSYAFASASSSASGQYNRFDIAPTKYYVVSKLSVGGTNLSIFDSITVGATSIKRGTMILK
jgi:hypothetical protein